MALAVGFQRLLQLALPDEAPGSDHVGHDIDLQALFAHGIAQEKVGRARYFLPSSILNHEGHKGHEGTRIKPPRRQEIEEMTIPSFR
jgi:hypothetical protein